MGGSPEGGAPTRRGMSPQDVLHAWRDFECSFFAGALLAPKAPFRRFLARESLPRRGRREDRAHAGGGHAAHDQGLALSATGTSSTPIRPATCARCIAATASRCPGATWRRSPIPCPHWAVFRMLDETPRAGPRLADLGAARRRAVAALLLPLAAHQRHGRQPARAVGRRRPRAGAALARRRRRRRSSRASPTPACSTAARRRFPEPPSKPIRAAAARAEHRLGRGRARHARRASSARAAPTARAPSAATARPPRARARSPTCARKSSRRPDAAKGGRV